MARQAVAGIHTAATFTRADLIETITAALPVDAAAAAGVSPRELVETLAEAVLIPVTAQRAPHQREDRCATPPPSCSPRNAPSSI